MLGFTKQEQGIVLFLIFTLIVGSIVTLYNRYFGEINIPEVSSSYIEEFGRRTDELMADSLDKFTPDEDTVEYTVKSVAVPPQEFLAQYSTKYNNKTSTSVYANKYLININTADQEELQNIPRIGPVIAQKIIDFRKRNGSFKRVEDLKRVKGIGNATLEKIKPYVKLN